MMQPNDPNEGTGAADASQADHQLAANLQAARRELRRKTRELETSEAARAAAEDMLQRMIAFFDLASHDLRTPLTAIIGYSDLLAMGIPERLSDGSRERVQRIRTSAKHLLFHLNAMIALVPDRRGAADTG
jgi:signal transduction histidine kinase